MNEADTKIAPAVSDADARAAFEALAKSNSFSGSGRLIGFLQYVVEEKLQGRGELIRGKSIALDVYGYQPDEVEQRESVVRVDAGRVRRKLKEYYEAEGHADLVQIDLPKGGYVPIFHPVPGVPLGENVALGNEPTQPRNRVVGFVGVVLLFVGALGFGVWYFQSKSSLLTGADTESVRRTVLFETSPQRLQSVNLAEQGRNMIFPALNPERLRAALLVFESAVQLDETYAGGYAGASQVRGLMSLLTTDKNTSDSLLSQSISLSETAVELAPGSAWTISARAWAEFASGDYEAAMSWSDKARRLEPLNPHVLEFNALIFLYSGEFARVIQETSQVLKQTEGESGYVFRNARAASYFHEKSYVKSIKDFEAATANGAPMGPVTVAYMMAANHYLGQKERANELAGIYEANWPGYRVDLVFSRLFKSPEYGDQLAQGMFASGWNPD